MYRPCVAAIHALPLSCNGFDEPAQKHKGTMYKPETVGRSAYRLAVEFTTISTLAAAHGKPNRTNQLGIAVLLRIISLGLTVGWGGHCRMVWLCAIQSTRRSSIRISSAPHGGLNLLAVVFI